MEVSWKEEISMPNTLEEQSFLTEQIITYIGNKRKLLPYIEAVIKDIKCSLGKDRLVCADLFSGSGIVARMMKQYSSIIITNDMEDYCKIINDCYLTNKEDLDFDVYSRYKAKLDEACQILHSGVIALNYAPKDDTNIKPGERVFYTTRNAMYIDTAMDFILSEVESSYQKFFIAPLLYEASVHANTSGVFKGFYKNSETGIGQYGGTAENCLERITKEISIKEPVLSNYSAKHLSLQGDTNVIVKGLSDIDIAYLDPPYNQHGYGSNYFMLNTILHHEVSNNISKVSGIPSDWNRSDYNKKATALASMNDLITSLNSRYIVISYNNEGFIEKSEMEKMLKRFGNVKTISIKYNTFRGSRNLKNREKYVDEYLFVLRKAV